jgi:hypothetical protein
MGYKNNNFLNVYHIKLVGTYTFCNFAEGFQNFLMMKKSNLKFPLASMKLLTNFVNPFSNPLQRPNSGGFGPKMPIGSRL